MRIYTVLLNSTRLNVYFEIYKVYSGVYNP